MNTAWEAQAPGDAAADALIEAAVAYNVAWISRAEDPQWFEVAQAPLKTAIDKSEELWPALEAICDADDIEIFEGMLDQVQQSTARASEAVDRALEFVAESNKRLAKLESPA